MVVFAFMTPFMIIEPHDLKIKKELKMKLKE